MSEPKIIQRQRELTRSVCRRHIPEESDVGWGGIVALRNIVAHEYFGINEETIWDVVQHKIPRLQKQIQHILQEK